MTLARSFRVSRQRLRSIFDTRAMDAEIAHELSFHFDLARPSARHLRAGHYDVFVLAAFAAAATLLAALGTSGVVVSCPAHDRCSRRLPGAAAISAQRRSNRRTETRLNGSRHLQSRPTPISDADGLSFLSPDPIDVQRLGLTAVICDVSSAERANTDDGSVTFFRSGTS